MNVFEDLKSVVKKAIKNPIKSAIVYFLIKDILRDNIDSKDSKENLKYTEFKVGQAIRVNDFPVSGMIVNIDKGKKKALIDLGASKTIWVDFEDLKESVDELNRMREKYGKTA
jgi:hypothetical protein